VLAGCFSKTYRYVDVTDSADTMRRRLEERGREHDMPVTHDGDKTTLWRKPPREALPAGVPRKAWPTLKARFQRLAPDRTRIEFEGDLDGAGATVLPKPPGRVAKLEETIGWSELLGVGFDAGVSAGLVWDPEYHVSGRLDVALRFGVGLHHFGRPDDLTRHRWSLAGSAGIGVRFAPRGVAFRPELLVSLARQRAAWFVPWQQLPAGERATLDLGLAALIEERGGRRGVEVGLSARYPTWGGLYVRAGALRGSGDLRGGPIVSAGLESGTIPSIGVAVIGVILGAVVSAAGKGASDGFLSIFGGG
jgi:hypothetical protein